MSIDVFGHIWVKNYRSELKRYGLIFTCMVSRAIHIEKLSTMDTCSFLNAFRRFVCRRGCPIKVYSDNGRNFVSGERELRLSMRDLSEAEIKLYAVSKNINWEFVPPYAPHWNGVTERLVGVVKRVLKALFHDTVRLNDEILETVLCEAENIVNNRPLTKLSDDANDFVALTPNHLLMVREGPSLPPGKFSKDDVFRKRFRHAQYLVDQFWSKWLKLYLPELQKRCKWTDVKANLSVGSLVLVEDGTTPRHLWPLALVEEVTEGRDGHVRSVKLRTRSSKFVRPLTKIILLERSEDNK